MITYRPEIDGLRALAVLAVVLYHAEITIFGLQPFQGGFIGVDVFFVISGYLISAFIFSQTANGDFSFRNFYERRARRLLPALFVVLLTTLPFTWAYLLPEASLTVAKSMLATLLFNSNHYFLSEVGYFDAIGIEKPLLHTWSLAVEEQFYFIFPLVLVICLRRAPNYVVGILTLGLLASLQIAHFGSGAFPEANFYLLPSRLWELLIGVLLAYFEFKHQRRVTPVAGSLMPPLGLFLILHAVVFFDDDMRHPAFISLLPAIGTALIIWYGQRAELVSQLLSSRPAVAIGLISYSLYLWHFPIFSFAWIRFGEQTIVSKLGLIGLAMVLATATFFAIERPCRRRTRLPGKRFIVVMVGSFVLLSAVCVHLIATDGWRFRYPERDLYLLEFDRAATEAYVWERRNDLQAKPFNRQGKKVAIVGDSQSADLINAIYESGNQHGLQISSLFIRFACGNVYVDEDITEHIAPRWRKKCRQGKHYKDGDYLDVIADADYVVLASNWKTWEVAYLAQTLTNIRAITDAKLIVVGVKDFGRIDAQELLALPDYARRSLRHEPAEHILKVNRQMQEVVEPAIFVDLIDLLCGSAASCEVFDDDLNLISYDGGHLSAAGAKFMGQRLRLNANFADMFEQHPVEPAKATNAD